MIKTNLLGTQPSCEQEYTPVCTDDGILFGPKTGQKVTLSLMDGQLVRLDAFNIQASIKIYLLDQDPGAACADCGTGFKKPYAPCGDCSPKSLETWNTTEYVRGPGVFQFESAGIAGTAYVKMVELNSIAYEEFCKKCEPPPEPLPVCEKPTISLVSTQTDITATVTNGPGTIVLMPGNISLVGSGPFTFKKLQPDTQYALTFTNGCGESVSDSIETAPAVIPPKEEEYCASMALPGGGFYYHYADSRDPDATVPFTDFNGSVLGYVYPTPGPGHTLEIKSCCPEPVTIGWGVNRSSCNVEPNMIEIYQAMCLPSKASCGCKTSSPPQPVFSTDVSVNSQQTFVVVSPSPGPNVGSSGTVTFMIRNVGNNSDASKFFWNFPSGLNVTDVNVSYIGGANGMSVIASQSGQSNVNLPDGGGVDVVFRVTAATAGNKVVTGNVTTPLIDTNSANNSTQQTVIVS